jgi:hypothetical protein
MNNFRSVTFWKSAIMTLPDNAFFDLLRTVFGKVKTPFNKQVLMGDLEKFLLRDDIKNNIANYIDTHDTLVITAIAALDEPSQSDLDAFFDDTIDSSELYDLVINLEERFILYRFFEKEKGNVSGRLALNPVLAPILSPLAENRSLLFPSVPINEDASPQEDLSTLDENPFADDRIFAALLSFVSQNKIFFRAGGDIRQKVCNAAKAMFPGLEKAGLSLETLIGALQVLGLFFSEDETLCPDYQRFAVFAGLRRQERLAYCAAGILCHADFKFKEGEASGTFSPWLFRAKVHNYAELINRLYNSLDPQRLYPPTTIHRLAYMQDKSGRVIKAMEKTGLIVQTGTYWRKAPLVETASSKEDSPSGEGVVIAMDTPFTMLVYPEIAYNDSIGLAGFSDVIEAGMTVRFELSKDSVVRAFNRNFSAAMIIKLLQRLSHNRISESLIFSLHDWEKRHKEVTLSRGLVLTLSPEQRHLAETKPLAKLIVETLAPGIYLLPESAEEKAAQILYKAGVTIIARRGGSEALDNSSGGEFATGPLRNFFQPLDSSPVQSPSNLGASDQAPPATESYDTVNYPSASILTEGFHSILKKMRLGEEDRNELAARIDRRLVLCESQLKEAVVRYEKLEARGLDYVGKAMIAKQAIALQTPIEAVWPGKEKQERAFGIPKALEKTDGESILVIDMPNEGETIRLPLGKISLLRRKKKSIFET